MSKNKDYILAIDNAERRFVNNPVKIQKRKKEDKSLGVVEGYAAKFNKRTVIGDYFEEEILPGAFDAVLKDDVRCLKNHEPSLLLARSNNGKGTLTLSVDKTGLKYSFNIPKRTVGYDLADELETGDITQSSFAFIAEEVVWIDREGELPIRQIKKIKQLFDVSPVTYPAYQDTSVGKRTLDQRIANIEVKDQEEIKQKKRAMNKYSARHKFNINNK